MELAAGILLGALITYAAQSIVHRSRLRASAETVTATPAATAAPAPVTHTGTGGDVGDDAVVPVASGQGCTRLVRRDAILFLQARGDYVRIVTEEGRFLTRARISELEQRWEPHGFVRVHRGYVANLQRAVEVRPMVNGTAVLAYPGDREVPVARRKVGELRRRLTV